MTNEEIARTLQTLKENLINNYAVFHERVSLLIQLTSFEIDSDCVNFRAQIIKPLNKEYSESDLLYKYMIGQEEIIFGSSFSTVKGDSFIKGKKIGDIYCPFKLWLDPELTQFVLESEDHITKLIPDYILFNENWTVLRDKSI